MPTRPEGVIITGNAPATPHWAVLSHPAKDVAAPIGRIPALGRSVPGRDQRGKLRAIGAAALIMGVLLCQSLPAIAAPATPVAAPTTRPRCLARPIAPAELATLLRQPTPVESAGDHPTGEAMPPAARAPLGDLVGRWGVCLATGNTAALLGLFTPDGVRRLFAERTPLLGSPAGLRVAILSVSDVVRLADGRIAGRVTIDPSGQGTAQPVSLLMVVAQGGDGAWRIDSLRIPAESAALRAPLPPLLRRPIAPGPAVALPPPGPNVPMRGGDAARTGNQAGPPPTAAPVERWRTPTGGRFDAQPIVARGLALVSGFSLGGVTPLIAGVDAASGGIRWQTTAPVAWGEFAGTPALSGDTLFAPVQAPLAGILAVVAGTGEPLWYAPFGFTSLTAPAVDTDRVYVAGWGLRNARDRAQGGPVGAVIVLDQRTGRERWRFLAPVRFGPLAVGRDAVFVPSDHGLFALDRTTGHKRWQARFSPGPGITPTIAGSTVVFTGVEVNTGKAGLFALDAGSGALRWRVDLPATSATAGTAVAADTVFATWWERGQGARETEPPTLRAFDLASGKERWVFRAGDAGAAPGSAAETAVTAPVVAGEMVLFGVGGVTSRVERNPNGLYAVDMAKGQLRWQVAAAIGSPPAVLGGRIFVMGAGTGDAASGALLAFGPAG